ncbi:hypothetical protein [Paractinoplanes atraurantiacus]|uniref:Uncharacterized protein n=1 Tax=Paractinoplanes atraurantiacus TaxID=1036182 RepID=A0A285IY57_9ACTN|nr:hypothetical protein [Actinoplanes atraurantiacus]SNY52912.1 hypothetical protein SAMN05421748_113131 [Actinoplanes atraurantiacus]
MTKSRKKSKAKSRRPAILAAAGVAAAGVAAVVIGRRKNRAESEPAAEAATATPLAPVSTDSR